MVVVLAIDALEYEKVEEFNCKNFKQTVYGKTDISEFKEPRTIVLWSSFITGRNKEQEILARGNKEMWNISIPMSLTFFSKFKNPKIIDLPAFSYDKSQHEKERELLKQFFEEESRAGKDRIRRKYNQLSFEHHNKIKSEFLYSLKESHDFVLGYFSVADVIGHLNFGDKTLMKLIYDDLDRVAGEIREIRNDHLLVLSDHGMKAIGIFGEHSNYGFWSFSTECGLRNPKITDFAPFLNRLRINYGPT